MKTISDKIFELLKEKRYESERICPEDRDSRKFYK